MVDALGWLELAPACSQRWVPELTATPRPWLTRARAQMASEIYHNLKKIIKGKYGQDSTSVGDEGGFAPNVLDNKEALDLVVEAIEAAGYTGKIEIGMDVAASEFYTEDKMYDLDFKTEGDEKDEKLMMTGEQLNDTYVGFCNDYPMASIEDPFDQEVRIASHRMACCCVLMQSPAPPSPPPSHPPKYACIGRMEQRALSARWAICECISVCRTVCVLLYCVSLPPGG